MIGNPRSGTSLLRLMLNNHPFISVPPECGFVVWLYEKYKNEKFVNKKLINNFIIDLLGCKKFETWGLSKSEIVKCN